MVKLTVEMSPMPQMIATLIVSKHAQERKQQRGFTNHDVELVCRYGIPVTDGYLMTRHAVREAATLPGERQRAERLLGAVAIVQESVIVTVFRASKKWRTSIIHKSRRHARRQSRNAIYQFRDLGETA